MSRTLTDAPRPTPGPAAGGASGRGRVRDVVAGLWLIVTLELRQRVRGVAWYVLLGIFMLLVAAVTILLWLSTTAWETGGGGVFSTVILFVLLLGTLVSPALSGNAINGDRDIGTLATTQVTLISTGQLVLGKFVAAWITALAFLAAAVPFLLFAVALGEVSLGTIAVSVLVLAVELGVIAAVGVGLSGIVTRPLFSIVVTYLIVAALSVGTLISFALLGTATRSEATTSPASSECPDPTTTREVPRFDYYWWVLAANPYVVLADASPGVFDAAGNPQDLFGWIAVSVRQAQAAPDLQTESPWCDWTGEYDVTAEEQPPTPRETYDGAVPSWFVGLGIHLALAVGALLWAWRRTITPARRLPTGRRVA
ncbi:ABC transporter permease [Cryobacterium sp. Sr8]|uniref:ABC transporter permease n=1 Tax=Cryobacterium sp. Sr8 TaxID=1259203 RepID=UPI001F53EE8A|nr:ABC transporter permease [Cryobacterium sp. Sr8]